MEEAVKSETTADTKPAKSVDTLFEERAAESDNEAFAEVRHSLFLRAVILSALILVGLFFLSPDSKVRTVSVHGTDYLSGSYVQKISGISIGDAFYLQFPTAVAARIERDPMIEEAEVQLRRDNIIEITVEEKQPIGYRYDEEVPTVLFTDGTVCDLTSDYMSLLSRVPFITGFNEENATHLLTSGFQEIDPKVIERMAEVIQYPLSYDDEAIEIRMRDGGIFFGNYFSLALLNEYETIRPMITSDDMCIYADNSSSVLASRACPWDEVEIVLEYWTDEEGNYIYNKWGDRAVRHYYQDNNGNYYLDDNGNRILIPIDEYGSDVKDPDFLNHFFEGWYKNGVMEEPVEEEEEIAETEEGEDTEDASEDAEPVTEEQG